MSSVMRMLMWKDLRLSRTPVIGGMVVLVLPYVVGSYTLGRQIRLGTPVVETLEICGGIALVLMMLVGAALAGNVFAGERQERSAAFAWMHPVARWRMVLSKVVVSGALAAGMVTVGVMAVVVPRAIKLREGEGAFAAMKQSVENASGAISVMTPLALGMFGLSWLWSTVLKSATISTVAGMACTVAIAALTGTIADDSGMSADAVWRLVGWMTGGAGVLGLVAGAVQYVLRRQP